MPPGEPWPLVWFSPLTQCLQLVEQAKRRPDSLAILHPSDFPFLFPTAPSSSFFSVWYVLFTLTPFPGIDLFDFIYSLRFSTINSHRQQSVGFVRFSVECGPLEVRKEAERSRAREDRKLEANTNIQESSPPGSTRVKKGEVGLQLGPMIL